MAKDLLEGEEVYRLKLVDKKRREREGDCSLASLASGLALDFSPHDPFLFAVGTEEGGVHLCCTAYAGEYARSFEGHALAVLRVRFSPFCSETLLSASADWTLKVWNTGKNQALLVFELG